MPYEFLLKLPYVLTLIVLAVRRDNNEAPAHLGIPYLRRR
jgi:ABC-type uncharacterized transport system permease subunit